jgi:hypothetical protein
MQRKKMFRSSPQPDQNSEENRNDNNNPIIHSSNHRNYAAYQCQSSFLRG